MNEIHCRVCEKTSRRSIWAWLLRMGLFTLLALVLVVIALTLESPRTTPSLPDSRFVMTSYPRIGLPLNSSIKDRVIIWCFRQVQKFREAHPRPLAYSFPAGPDARCSIHGLLNQCMEINGVTYMIPRDVAAGSVFFGHSNVLYGAQWVSAFTDALKTNQLEWWDSKTKKFRRENLILLTNGPRAVLVLPSEMAEEFQTKLDKAAK